MAFPAGVEPATLRLGGECSIQLSYENNITRSRLSKSKKRKQATYRNNSLPLRAIHQMQHCMGLCIWRWLLYAGHSS